MDGRSYGSGYSSWGSGGSGSRGSSGFGSYGGGFKDSMMSSGSYGAGGQMKRGISGGPLLSSEATHADSLIAKINQRLDMLSQLEGGFKSSRSDRFDQHESFDSRSPGLSSRDLYRSGGSSFGFGNDRGDSMMLGQRGGSSFEGDLGMGEGGGFDSPSLSYGVAKMRPNMRDTFASGQGGGSGVGGWSGAPRRRPRRGGMARGRGGGFGGHRPDPSLLGGGFQGSGSGVQLHSGLSPGGGRGKPPSLLANRMYPESGGFQSSTPGPHDFPGRPFGGGPRGGRQRGRKRPLVKPQPQQQVKPQNDAQKKRKQTSTGEDEPESKINRTDGDGTGETQEGKPATSSNVKQEDGNATNPGDTNTAESAQAEAKKPMKAKKRRGLIDKVTFACSVCKFRSIYKDDMEAHLESRFHKEHFKYLSSQLTKPTTDFLQEYLKNKFNKTVERVTQMENHPAAICQMFKDQDFTRELGMEHFMRKVEAAHCSACDVFIPMHPHIIQKHLKSYDHNYNRKGMMEHSKRGCLSVARSILNHKLIGKKLQSYLNGENPFVGHHDDQDAEGTSAVEASGQTSEAADGQIETVVVKEEPEDRNAPETEASTKVTEEEAPQTKAAAEEAAEEAATAGEEEYMEENDGKEFAFADEEEGFEVGEEDDVGYAVHEDFTLDVFDDDHREEEVAEEGFNETNE